MFVCLCNAFTDKDVTRAVREGRACKVDDVYRALGCEPNCGRCKPTIAQFLVAEPDALKIAAE